MLKAALVTLSAARFTCNKKKEDLFCFLLLRLCYPKLLEYSFVGDFFSA